MTNIEVLVPDSLAEIFVHGLLYSLLCLKGELCTFSQYQAFQTQK